MLPKILPLILILFILVLAAGCSSQTALQTPSSPAPALQVQQTPPLTPVPPENGTVTPGKNVVTDQPNRNFTPELTPSPVPSQKPVETLQPVRTQDPLVAFRDKTLLSLNNLQGAKEGILLTYQSGDMVRVKQKAEEYALTIRRNSEITDMPAKMDYVRLTYYEYIDQARQFAQSFRDGADRWIASDKSSANSLYDAGIMASSRADISEKRIRTFFDEHVQPIQINLT